MVSARFPLTVKELASDMIYILFSEKRPDCEVKRNVIGSWNG